MPIVKLDIDIDQEVVKKHIDKRLDEAMHNEFFLWDIDRMSKITCMSRSYLEQEILCHPRMRLLERRKSKGKRFWYAKESLEAIRDILDEW